MLTPGTEIGGDFVVERALKEGGMGAVYVATQRSTAKRRALKVMHDKLAPDPRSRQRFFEEAQVGGRIPSEHVVEVIAAGIDEERPWLAMELLEGEDLDARVKRAPLEWELADTLFGELGHALEAAHRQGIIHRDLKPENLFLCESKRHGSSFVLKVLDFGIAACMAEARSSVTVTTAIGSPLFMAPEQASVGAKLTPATDVWAIGLIAFHALTGRHYWKAGNQPAALQAILAEVMVHPIEPTSARAAELGAPGLLPAGFDAWFDRCVRRDPAERIATAGPATDALRALLRDHARANVALAETAPAPAVAPTAVLPPEQRPGRRAHTAPPASTAPLSRDAEAAPATPSRPPSPKPSDEEDVRLPVRKVGMGALAAGVVAALALGVGGIVWATSDADLALGASLVSGDDGEVIDIAAPSAAAGTRVRIGDVEEALEDGHARLSVPPDGLHVGDNELSVELIAPDGSRETETVALYVDSRVHADLSPLAESPPAIDVVVEAPAGSEVRLDGSPLELDGDGVGRRRFTLEDGTDEVIEHRVAYSVRAANGTTREGVLRTDVPRTTLELHSLGVSHVTERAWVDLTGVTAPGATVRIHAREIFPLDPDHRVVDAYDVVVTNGRFTHRLALPLGSTRIEVAAHLEGRASARAMSLVTRVEDLDEFAAESFPDGAEYLSYAQLAQNPTEDPDRRVRFEGLVYNVVHGHRGTELQILVTDCSDGERCPLWVSALDVLDTSTRQHVRVFGWAGGERQFRLQSGAVRTVPSVFAQLVLPAESER